MYGVSLLQPLGGQIKPVENARYEAYQMRVMGRSYHSSASDNAKGNSKELLESMMRPEVRLVYISNFVYI